MICRRNARKHQLNGGFGGAFSIIVSVHMAMLLWFVCHCVDLAGHLSAAFHHDPGIQTPHSYPPCPVERFSVADLISCTAVNSNIM